VGLIIERIQSIRNQPSLEVSKISSILRPMGGP
jgi:hypothetical protein